MNTKCDNFQISILNNISLPAQLYAIPSYSNLYSLMGTELKAKTCSCSEVLCIRYMFCLVLHIKSTINVRMLLGSVQE